MFYKRSEEPMHNMLLFWHMGVILTICHFWCYQWHIGDSWNQTKVQWV